MRIIKRFKVESAHIVRNCTSERCSHSIHGHSAKIEVEFSSDKLDNAQMVLDFGLMNNIKSFIDSMDHTYLLCKSDREDFKNFIKSSCDRWIELPFNPSAEMLSLFIFEYTNNILNHTITSNGESRVVCSGVRYWETETGSVICNINDSINLWRYDRNSIIFSDGIIRDWSDQLRSILIEDKMVENQKIRQQIKL